MNSAKPVQMPTPHRRSAVFAAALFVLAGVGMLPLLLPGLPVGAQTVETVDLVVDFDDGHVAVRRAAASDGATGMDLLERSGLTLTRSGGAICAVGGVGCPADNCFCHPERFWAYHHQTPDPYWAFAETGPADHLLEPGDVDGWVWSGTRPPVTATAEMRAVAVGFAWLEGQLLPGGSIGDHPGLTAEAVFAARAAGISPASWRSAVGAHSPMDFLAAQADDYSATGPAAAGKLAAAVAAGGAHPRHFAGVDIVARISEAYDPATGWFGASSWDQAWAMIGLAASGEPVPAAAVQALAGASVDGGWGVAPDVEPDADSTGLAVQALVAAGEPVTSTAITGAIDYFRVTQNEDGGWGHGDDGSNANSTAFALQGLNAAGVDRARWSAEGRGDPQRFLLGLQLPDGRFEHDASPADLVATLQSLPAVAGHAFPMGGTAVAAARAVDWMAGQRTDDGAFAGFNPGATIDAVIALAALGRDPRAPAPSGRTAADYLAEQAGEYSTRGPSAAGKLVAGVVALGGDPRAFGGVDVVAAVSGTLGADGRFGEGGTWDQAWALIGLAAAGEAVPPTAVEALVDAAAPDGGWGFERRADAATADSTGLALQALRAAGVPADHAAIQAGVDALRRLQSPDAGFAGFGGETNANATALAIGGLVAARQHVTGPGWARDVGSWGTRTTPLDALAAGQSPSGGFAGFSGPNDPGATYAAVFGLAASPLPIRPATLYLPMVARVR